MLFSLDWLTRLCPVSAETEAVVEALTARGLTVDAVNDAATGRISIDVDIPANRPDCLGHRGLARELSAAFGVPLVAPPSSPPGKGGSAESRVRLDVEDAALCPRYTAGIVRGVRVGPSPQWVVERLECCGLRSVNNVVDASNLVLLELAHPVHFFDLARLRGDDPGSHARIRVRTARAGEKLTTLDGIDRALDPSVLLIADGARAVALAGVMGGADSEISEATRDVLVEAARFDPRSVRATARRLALQTDASFRFERGVDADGVLAAQRLSAALLHELAGGTPAPGIVDFGETDAEPPRLRLRPDSIARLLGYSPGLEAAVLALRALGLHPEVHEGTIEVRVPSFRIDLEREADLVEEVARHLGYDQIPESVISVGGLPEATTDQGIEDDARDRLAPLGFHEALGYAMIGEGEDDRFVPADSAPPVALTNPIAEPLARLRRSILPGLLRSADFNLRRGVADVRLFEIGKVFRSNGEGRSPDEPRHVGLAWSGQADPPHWGRPRREPDLYDLIGIVEHLLVGIRPAIELSRASGGPDALHPACRVRWSLGGQTIAWGGALHPELQQSIDRPLLLAEIDLEPLAATPRRPDRYTPVARYPSVTRDLSLVLSRDLGFERLLDVLTSVPPPAPVRFEPFDRYTGPPLADEDVSLSVRVILEPLERTLTDPESEAYRQALVHRLQSKLGVRIRG